MTFKCPCLLPKGLKNLHENLKLLQLSMKCKRYLQYVRDSVQDGSTPLIMTIHRFSGWPGQRTSQPSQLQRCLRANPWRLTRSEERRRILERDDWDDPEGRGRLWHPAPETDQGEGGGGRFHHTHGHWHVRGRRNVNEEGLKSVNINQLAYENAVPKSSNSGQTFFTSISV